MDEDIPALVGEPVAELVGTEDEVPNPVPNTDDGEDDDDDELLPEDVAAIEDTTLLDKELITEDALILDGVFVELKIFGTNEVITDAIEVEEFATTEFAEELAEMAGNGRMELPLPTVEGALEDEVINWGDETELEGPVLWLIITLVEEGSKFGGLALGPVTTLVEGEPRADELIFWPASTLVEGEPRADELLFWTATTLVEGEPRADELIFWTATTLIGGELRANELIFWTATTLVVKDSELDELIY